MAMIVTSVENEGCRLSECFLLFTFGTRPVCALPAGASARVRRAAASRLLGYTLKRRAVRAGLITATSLRLDRQLAAGRFCVSELPGLSYGDGILSSLDGLGGEHRLGWKHVAIYWPSQLARDRAYFHLLNADGESVAFTKVSGSADSGLVGERAALDGLSGGRPGLFRSPMVLATSGKHDDRGYSWLALEALPDDIRPCRFEKTAFPRQAVDAYQSDRRWTDRSNLHELSWWNRATRGVPKLFAQDLIWAVGEGFEVGRVHGDLGAHNMARSREDLWIYDWESSALDGPAFSDYWAFQFLLQPPVKTLYALRESNLEQLREAIVTLAYQASANVRYGPAMVQSWARIREEIGL